MIYVFDSSSFRVINHYFPERFPSFWKLLDEYVLKGQIISVREVYNELERQGIKPYLKTWVKVNKKIFLEPNEEEGIFIREIFTISHFKNLIGNKQILNGRPNADPFVISSARIKKACVVTEESKMPNAARIPNICEHFKIDCIDIEGFMERESWEF